MAKQLIKELWISDLWSDLKSFWAFGLYPLPTLNDFMAFCSHVFANDDTLKSQSICFPFNVPRAWCLDAFLKKPSKQDTAWLPHSSYDLRSFCLPSCVPLSGLHLGNEIFEILCSPDFKPTTHAFAKLLSSRSKSIQNTLTRKETHHNKGIHTYDCQSFSKIPSITSLKFFSKVSWDLWISHFF